jgi:hypothetical protein
MPSLKSSELTIAAFVCTSRDNRKSDVGGVRSVVLRRATFSLAALALSVGTPARAAVLDGINGQVMVKRGGTYRLVKGPMELKPGESVVANPGGSAVISYTDGCNVPVAADSVVAVSEASPCAVSQGPALSDSPEAFAFGGDNGAGLNDSPKPFAIGGVDGTTLAIGALAVGGVVGAVALIAGGGEKDKPASP